MFVRFHKSRKLITKSDGLELRERAVQRTNDRKQVKNGVEMIKNGNFSQVFFKDLTKQTAKMEKNVQTQLINRLNTKINAQVPAQHGFSKRSETVLAGI